MSPREVDIYELTLYGLLHDIGKPVIRLAYRYKNGVESDSKVKKLLNDLLISYSYESEDQLIRMGHEEFFKKFIEKFLSKGFSEEYWSRIKNILIRADALAAAERGYETSYTELVKNLIDKFYPELSKKLGVTYNHYQTPLLSPTWMLLITNYRDGVGVNLLSGKTWNYEIATKYLRKELINLINALQELDTNKILYEEYKLLNKLINEPLWFPIKTIKPNNIVNLETYSYNDSHKNSSYYDVISLFLELFDNYAYIVKKIHGTQPKIKRGMIETILEILKTTMLFVPSAIFGSIVPDINLYSHSKAVAAYTASLTLSNKMRLLVVDANNIQRFISAPRTFAAASRLLRGRSLLVEFLLDSIARYVLEVFGGLPSSNIIVFEGGTLDIVIPDDKVDVRVNRIEKVINELTEKLGGELGFTIIYSDPFTVDELFFKPFIEGKEKGFHRILEKLLIELSLKKTIRSSKLVKEYGLPKDFDTLTNEPVIGDQTFKITTQEHLEYVAKIAGADKLSLNDIISYTTHLSLIAGTTSRNLIAIISIHSYTKEEPRKPHRIYIEQLLTNLRKYSAKTIEGKSSYSDYELLFRGNIGDYRITVGIIPLLDTGSIYYLVSLDKDKPVDPSSKEDIKDIWSILYLILNEVFVESFRELEDALTSIDKPGYISLRIELANISHYFIPTKELLSERLFEELTNTFKKISKFNIDLSFGYRFTISYHPVKAEVEKDRTAIRLLSLDEYKVVGLAKLDIDRFGDVRLLLSFSPSRLVSLSDIVNTVIMGKTYLSIIDYSIKLSNKYGYPVNFDVIPLYAGGDDIVIYGNWIYTTYFLSKLLKELCGILYPLTSSAGIYFGESHLPILDLYRRVLNRLDKAKEIRASVALPIDEPRKIEFQNKEYIIDVIPVSESSWRNCSGNEWSFILFNTLFKPESIKNNLSMLQDHKHDLYILSNIGGYYQNYLSSSRRKAGSKVELIKLEIGYAYVWSRRERNMTELCEKIDRIFNKTIPKPRILKYPEDIVGKTGIDKALDMLACAKPFIDLIIMAMRRPEYISPSKIYG